MDSPLSIYMSQPVMKNVAFSDSGWIGIFNEISPAVINASGFKNRNIFHQWEILLGAILAKYIMSRILQNGL